jgi:hypothetical protein
MIFGRFAQMALLGAVLYAAPAGAEVADFYGIWANATADASGIARIVVAPEDGGRASIHLFGRCQPVECDWGTQQARTYSDAPGSSEVHSLAAEFDAGGAHRRIVLYVGIGHVLRFEEQADFTDGSARSNYAAIGGLAYAGDWSSAARLAATPPPTSGTAPQTVGSGGPSFLGFGPAAASGYVPAPGEDCRPFNPDQVRVGVVDGQWRLGDFSTRLVNFGPRQAEARSAMAILAFYHFDEQCFVGHTTMIYWKRAGQLPTLGMKGDDCAALDPGSVAVVQADGVWRVASHGATLLEYDDKADAERAVSVIRTYRLTRQCFLSRDVPGAQYWLAK